MCMKPGSCLLFYVFALNVLNVHSNSQNINIRINENYRVKIFRIILARVLKLFVYVPIFDERVTSLKVKLNIL